MPFDSAVAPQTLADHFLSMANNDPRAALEAACAVCELLASHVSRGECRLPPAYQVRAAKPAKPAILNPDEDGA